ncbi:hypothetical protein GCM10023206_33230 [Acinetobacter puyangensis]|uniref:Uncharacterized protein n=1 Tax=Acinetobacter puyangensis TaxID=1096779 RepID=A0A240ECK4_9GAMM|nr:hypothetical protein [Acinetobacter puyangensis]SNX46447.1 hypothetical protein SAMN05421731_11215 [Acinetobacter puyangensis]
MAIDTNLFKIHDVSRFPLCVFRADQAQSGYATQWEREMVQLLHNAQLFTIVYIEFSQNETHEDRKQRGLWLKHHKNDMNQYCKALISVEPDQEKRILIEQQAEIAVKAFGTPHYAVGSLAEAENLTQQLTLE